MSWIRLISALIIFSATAYADTSLKFAPASGETNFLATGRPGSFKIRGKGPGPDGVVAVAGNQVKGSLTLDLNGFDTGMKMRNEHMKTKYLQTDKFPKAELQINSASLLPGPLKSGAKYEHSAFDGKLTLHGQTKDVHGTFDSTFDGDKLALNADFDFSINDFGIEKPSFSGISVDDKVQVHLTSEAHVSK